MKHWNVPGVVTWKCSSLPRAKNLSRETEHVFGTSRRDPIAFAYFHIKALTKSPDSLKEYLHAHVLRIVFLRLKSSSIPEYQSLSHYQRLDLALTDGIITQSVRTLIGQIEFEANSKILISVFVNFLKEIQESPLEFQPVFQQLLEDKEIFQEDEEALRLNQGFIRVL